ncbi:sodium/proline symporter PutP [Christensenella timonensis]|uniref:sodium/proline symporter PutP n=1 Tax=Christensenella timonensis TaxID=1816678 RepID=UPI0008370293|nr:sodium/proline symporter PutP [Christensenella timonensis]
MELDWGVVLSFIGYFIFVLLIGFYFYKKSSNISDYMLGGRGLHPAVAALSAQASDMSGWLLMGLPGALYLSGMSEVWIGVGLAVGAYCSWLVVAKRLRQYSYVAGDSITIPQFFENRFKDEKGVLRFISSAVILVFFTFYVVSGFVSGGTVFKAVFPGMDYTVAMVICAAVIIAYTFMGGFKAVCWTDFFQGMLMLVAIFVVPLAVMGKLGGPAEAVAAANQVAPGFLDPFTTTNGEPLAPMSLISNLAWGLGYFGMPHIIIRYMAIKEPRMIKASRRIATGWIILALIGAVMIGIFGRVYLGDMFTDAAGAQTVFLVLAGQLFVPVIAGILLSAILAAVMSTADSQLLVASSAITADIYGKLAKKKPSEKKLMWIGRIGVIAIAVLAAFLARDPNTSIMSVVSFAWAGFGSAFGPIVLLALFWKRTTKNGALAGMVVGFVVSIVWNQLLAGPTGVYEMIPGFGLALLTCVIASLAGKAPSEEIQKEFDEAVKCEA